MQNIETGWFFSDLGKYRPIEDYSTYVCFSYEALPPLPSSITFKGDYDWLSTQDPSPAPDEDKLLTIIDQANTAGIDLPKAFLAFMGNDKLRAAAESVSCTACYFEFTHGLIPVPNSSGEYLIHFLSDQQYCLLWYLYIKDGKEAGVLVSPYFFGADGNAIENYGRGPITGEKVLYCAPEFERFIYRFWLENVLWDKVSYNPDKANLNTIEKNYVDHYETLKKT